MTRRKLPTGVQTFRKIREEDCYYVDKTAYIHKLVTACEHCFLSRPRRFGKSLLVDTLKELFEGNEALFRGLAIHKRWDWAVRHPVLRLSFAGGSFKRPGQLESDFADQLTALEDDAGLTPRYSTPARRFAGLIKALRQQTGRRAVLLVDEYDRPMNDALGDPPIARDNRDFLRGVYGMVKDCDADLRFSFFTGVSKFSKVSVFSDLNNLTDITLDRRFAAICGYTEADLDHVFAAELEGLDRKTIRDWYNGYSWRGGCADTVYNPYGMLLLLEAREFRPYWFETGTLLRAFFASVPYQWYTDNDIAHYEGYYSAVFYAHFVGAGLDVVAEESTSRGRSDIVVRHPKAVWVFELKGGPGSDASPAGRAGRAVAQIAQRGYAEKYRHLGLPIHCVGVTFSDEDRNISAFQVERH